MPRTATNPTTGEKIILLNGQWMPIVRTATNPTTGERIGLVGGEWVPIGRVEPTPTSAQPTPTPGRPTPAPVPAREAPEDLATTRANTVTQLNRARERLASQQALLDNPMVGMPAQGFDALRRSVENAEANIATYEDALAYIDREGRAPPAATAGSVASDIIRGVPRGALRSVGQGIGGIEGLIGSGLEAAGAEQVGRALSREGAATERWWEQAGTSVAGAPSEASQYSPLARLGVDVGEGIGSTVPMIATEGLGAAASGLGATGRAARVARGVNYAQGAGQGSSQAGQTAQQFREEGGTVSPGQEFLARLGGVGLGLTEVGVINRMIERVPVASRQNAMNAVIGVVERATAGRVAPREAMAAITQTLARIEANTVGRIGLSAAEEALQEGGTELGQNLLARGIYDPNQDVFENVGYSALVGAITGGTIRGGTEAVQRVAGRVARNTGRPNSETLAAVNAEFNRLAAMEVTRVRQADPELSRNDAVALVMERAEELLAQAASNIVDRNEGADTDEAATAGTGLDDDAGLGAGAAPTGGPPSTGAGTTESGTTVAGGVGESDTSVPVSDDGAAAGEPALTPITAAQVKAAIPTIEQAFAGAALDPDLNFDYRYGVKELNAGQKKQAARIIIQSPEVDPYDAIESVIERGERLRATETATMGESPGTQRTVTTINGETVVQEGPTVTAPVEKVTPGSTGLAEVGSGMAGAVGENLRTMLLAKVEAGEVSEAGGQPSSVLQAAKLIKDAGVPVDAAVLERISMAVDDARQTGNFQGAMRAFVADTVQRAQPAPTPKQIVENLRVFGRQEAQDRGLDPPMFEEGVKDVQLGRELLTDEQVVDMTSSVRSLSGPEAIKAYRTGIQWAQDRVAEVQAASDEDLRPARETIGGEQRATPTPRRAATPTPTPRATEAPAKPSFLETMRPEERKAWQQSRDTYAALGVTNGKQATYEVPDYTHSLFQEGINSVTQGKTIPTRQQLEEAVGPFNADYFEAGVTAERKRALKAVILRAPGKTVAEKVYNIAKAELETLTEEELIEQSNLSPYTSNYETIRAKPGVNVRRIAQLLDSSLYGNPSEMGKVCIKEVFQNAFDATRNAVDAGQVAQGKININLSADRRTLRLTDNGVGMTPQLLGGKFLEIAGTGKEGDKNAGGFGIAKMMFLYQNKYIRVLTARDGKVAELNTSGEQLFESLEDSDNAPDINVRSFEPSDSAMFPDGHGTFIELTLPDKIGEHEIYDLPMGDYVDSVYNSPLFSNIDVDMTYDKYPNSPDYPSIGSRFPVQDYTQFVGVKFPWGTAKVYVSRQPTGVSYNNMNILSNGLWQFSKRVAKDPSNMYSEAVPYTFYVDIVPSVKPEEFGYPFNFNRQSFTDDAEKDFNKVKAFIDAIYAYNSMAGDVMSFGSVQYFDANGNLTAPVDLMPQIPVKNTAFTAVGQGDQITLSSDGSLLVNGQQMPELTPDQLKAGIPNAKELKLDPSLIDTNAIMVHDNADVVVKSTGEKLSVPEFMRRQFGDRYDEFIRYNGETFLKLREEVVRVMGYSGMMDEAIGVSLDPGYRGVSIRLPFSGSFINPLVPKYADGLRAGYGIFGTMVHELAHHKVRDHTDRFPAEMQNILLNMEADTGFNFERFKRDFAEDISDKYGDIVEFGVESFNGRNPDIRIEYRGNRFKDGSQESASDGAGDDGIGDVRGPSAAGSTGESVLGASYDSREDAGERGQLQGSSGGGTSPEAVEALNDVAEAKLTKAQIKRLEVAAGLRAGKMRKMQERIVRSRSAAEPLDLAGKLTLLARSGDDDVKLMARIYNSIPPTAFQKILGFMMTEDVVRLAGNVARGADGTIAKAERAYDKARESGDPFAILAARDAVTRVKEGSGSAKAFTKSIEDIDSLMRDGYAPYVNRILLRAEKVSDKWADFASRFDEGAKALTDVMFSANIFNVDPSLAPTATEYMKLDADLQALVTAEATATSPKEKETLLRQISKRRNDIKAVYNKTTDEKGNIVYGWNDLSSPEFGGGAAKQIFRMARDEHRNVLNEHYRLLMQRIDDSKFDNEKAVQLKVAIDAMFTKARERAIYFPVKRFGNYFVSVGKGGKGGFYLKESYSEAVALKQRLRREGEDANIQIGTKRSELRNLVANKDASGALKGILDMLEGGTVDDMDMLKDGIFQMYLSTLPEADMRRRFIHREFVTGFDTDTLRAYAATAVASANQLGRLAFKYKFDDAFRAANDALEENPSAARLMTIVNELDLRVKGIMSPPDAHFMDWINSIGAKVTFYTLLSAPSSAIVNMTQLHIVGLPTLAAEFGEASTAAMAARYTGTFLTTERIANPFRDKEGNVTLQMPNISLQKSRYISNLKKSDPDRYEAFLAAQQFMDEHEVTQSTFASDTGAYARSRGPSDTFTFSQAARKGDVVTAAQRGAANAVNAMGSLFHGTERINREIMFFSAFEMAYERALKQGKSAQEATTESIALANKLTNSAMFDFSGWNKSRYSKSRYGRLPLQMTSYRQSMTSLLFRSFVNMLALQRTKAERLAAARVFFGVGGMTTLYAGLRASQFYTLTMLGYGLYEFIKSMGDDDDDEEQEAEQGYLNPETFNRELLKYADEHGHELGYKDMDYYIRAEWIPDTFGPGGTLATALGIPDSVAAKLEAVADVGLPGVVGIDISNSVSLGDLWHTSDLKSDDPEVRFFERLGRLIGPVGIVPSRFIRAYTEANKGNLDLALEAAMPAVIRNYVKSERLQDEGLVIGPNRDITLQDPDFYDAYTSTMQALGFPEEQTSRAMQVDIQAGEIEDVISAEKAELMDQRYRASLALERNPTEETIRALSEVERAIDVYNLNYPSNSIGGEGLSRSFEQREEEAREREYGLGVDENIPVRQPLAERRLRERYGQ